MSEPRRVAFTTISSNVSQSTLTAAASGSGTAYRIIEGGNALMANKTSALFGGSGQNVDGTENRSKDNKTLRLELTLFQTDSSKYPEFDYSRLVHLEKKKMKKLKTRINGFTDDPFDNGNDDDVSRIARELEEKYGASYGGGRSRNRKNIANDNAIGYDESDSFIDNTEAFDENLPEEVETLEGGFYINCGALEFKKLHTEQLLKTKTDEIIKMPNRPKKRELSTSSSDDTSTTDEEDEVDDDEEADEEADDSSTTNNRQKSGNSSSSTTASVKTKKSTGSVDKNATEEKKQIILSSSSNSPKEMCEEPGSDSDKDRVPVKTTTVKDMLKAKRDSYLKNQINEDKVNSNGPEKSAESKSTDDEDEDSTSTTSDSEDTDNSGQSEREATGADTKLANTVLTAPVTNEEMSKKQEVKLPASLSANLIELLRNFKETALSKGMIGKQFQFDEQITEQFLKIDNLLNNLDKATRNLVLAHLEYHLQLRKYYFLRKEKQFRIKEEKQKNKRALAKLKKCIIETMPSAIAEYEVQLRKYADFNAANINADQPPIMPKKEFPWNNNLSNLLYEVYEVRLASYSLLRTRKESFEEFVAEYLRSKVLALWPNGWVRADDLQREIEKVKLARSQINKKPTENNIMPINQNATLYDQISSSNQQTVTATPAIITTVPTSNKRKHSDGTTKAKKSKSLKKNHANKPNELATNIKKLAASAGTVLETTEFQVNLQQQQNLTQISVQNTAATFSAFQQHHQQQQIQTHSVPTTSGSTKSAHVIDLDNYKSANDILQTSKHIINAVHQQQVGLAKVSSYKQKSVHVPESGSESDGVEFISVYPNSPSIRKNVSNKQKLNKNVDLLVINFPAPTSKVYPTNAPIKLNTNNNNNNNNYNRKNNIKVNRETLLKDSRNFEQKQMPTATTSMSKNTAAATRASNNQ